MRHAVDLVQKELADLRIVLAIVGHHLSGTDWRRRPATQAGVTPGSHTGGSTGNCCSLLITY
jgi:hypothetical protein